MRCVRPSSFGERRTPKGDYYGFYGAMIEKMLMDRIKTRVTRAFKNILGEDKQIILVLDNATYHHG